MTLLANVAADEVDDTLSGVGFEIWVWCGA